MEASVHQEKNLSINFSNGKKKGWLSYLFVNGKEIFKLKANNKNVYFPAKFCLGSISNGF